MYNHKTSAERGANGYGLDHSSYKHKGWFLYDFACIAHGMRNETCTRLNSLAIMLHGSPPFCERLSLPLQLLARSLVMKGKKNNVTTREMLRCLSNMSNLKKSLAASRPLRWARLLCPARNSWLLSLA